MAAAEVMVMTITRLDDSGGHSVDEEGWAVGDDGGEAGYRERVVEGHGHGASNASETVEGCGVYERKGMAVTNCHSPGKTSLGSMSEKSRPEDQKALEYRSEEEFPGGRDGASTACSSVA